MEFLSGSEKIVQLRKKYMIRQQNLATKNLTRGYIGLLENGKRHITEEAAKILTEQFKNILSQRGYELEIDDGYFLRSKEEEAEKYCKGKLEEILNYEELEQLLEISNQYRLNNIKLNVYMRIGDKNYEESDYIGAFENYFYSFDILRNFVFKKDNIYIYKKLGLCKYNLFNYSEAIVYFNKAKIAAEEFNDKNEVKENILNLALCYEKNSNIEKTLELIKKFGDMAFEEEKREEYVYAKQFEAKCYKKIGKVCEAVEIYNSMESLEMSYEVRAEIYNDLADIYIVSGDIKEALDFYNKSQHIRMNHDRKNLSHTLIEKASIYVLKELYDEALMIIELGIEKAKENNDYNFILKGYKKEKEIYEKMNLLEKVEKKLIEIIKLTNSEENKEEQIKAYIELADLYLMQKRYTELINCHENIKNRL